MILMRREPAETGSPECDSPDRAVEEFVAQDPGEGVHLRGAVLSRRRRSRPCRRSCRWRTSEWPRATGDGRREESSRQRVDQVDEWLIEYRKTACPFGELVMRHPRTVVRCR